MGQMIVSDLKFKWIYNNLPFNYRKSAVVLETSKWLPLKKYRMILGKWSAEDNLHKQLKVWEAAGKILGGILIFFSNTAQELKHLTLWNSFNGNHFKLIIFKDCISSILGILVTSWAISIG